MIRHLLAIVRMTFSSTDTIKIVASISTLIRIKGCVIAKLSLRSELGLGKRGTLQFGWIESQIPRAFKIRI